MPPGDDDKGSSDPWVCSGCKRERVCLSASGAYGSVASDAFYIVAGRPDCKSVPCPMVSGRKGAAKATAHGGFGRVSSPFALRFSRRSSTHLRKYQAISRHRRRSPYSSDDRDRQADAAIEQAGTVVFQHLPDHGVSIKPPHGRISGKPILEWLRQRAPDDLCESRDGIGVGELATYNRGRQAFSRADQANAQRFGFVVGHVTDRP